MKDAAPLYRHAPETRERRSEGRRRSLAFMREVLPDLPAKERTFVADLIMTAMSTIGKTVSEDGYSRAEVDRLATATGDMFCAYLRQLAAESHGPVP